MSKDEEILQKASDLLVSHRVKEIADDLLNNSYKFNSTPSLTFANCTDLKCVDGEVRGVTLIYEDNELSIITTKFKSVALPDGSHTYADGIISFNSELVLKVGVSKDYDEYGGYIDFSVYPHSIKSMKAGPWLEMLGSCYDILIVDIKRREEEERSEKDQIQASNINLDDY